MPYEQKEADDSSHRRVLAWLAHRPPGRVLDLGCSDGRLAERLRALGHHVTGVDLIAHDGVKERVDRFVEADLDAVCRRRSTARSTWCSPADVLEHVRRPDRILDQLHDASRRAVR